MSTYDPSYTPTEQDIEAYNRDQAKLEQEKSITLQQKMQSRLESCGLPYKEVKVYGSQIMITAWSESAARKWHSLLYKFCSKVRPPKKSLDYNKVNRNTCLRPTTHVVYRVWGTI